MKKLTLLFLAISSLLFANCKTKSKATTSTEKTTGKNDDGGTKVQCRLAIGFNSIGSGIDATAYDKIEAYIKAHPKKPAYDVIPMGREGERDICMGLKEMNKDEQKAFIEEIKKMAKTSDRVQVNENAERTKRP
ncbi:MAG TPA: hypothetical protein VN026_10950 [Bacteroidia bacterium]|nr:hypothetical protein [Bacteroidia bacterium]